jgi:SAM-dependent methyltransferase
MAELIAKQGFEVMGFDDSPASIGKARARLPKGKFWVGSMDKIELPDSSVDAVVSGEVLEHLEDDQAAVREMFRVLKPGAIAMVSVPGSRGLRWSIDDDWSGHKRRYTKAGLEGLFESAGFSTLDCRCWGFPVIYTYYRLYYIPMLKERTEQGLGQTGLAPSPFLAFLFTLALLPDRLSYLLRLPLGIGLIAAFQKQA